MIGVLQVRGIRLSPLVVWLGLVVNEPLVPTTTGSNIDDVANCHQNFVGPRRRPDKGNSYYHLSGRRPARARSFSLLARFRQSDLYTATERKSSRKGLLHRKPGLVGFFLLASRCAVPLLTC